MKKLKIVLKKLLPIIAELLNKAYDRDWYGHL